SVPHEVVSSGLFAGSRPCPSWGRPMRQRKKQVRARCGTAGGMGSSIQGKILGDKVGKVRRAAGTGDNLRRLLPRGKTEVEVRPLRLGNESVVAKKEE